MAEEFKVITNPILSVRVTSTISSFESSRRFQKDMTIAELKGKLELLTGASSAHMLIEVYNKDNQLVCRLDNDDQLLGSYPIDDDMRLHTIDKSGKSGQFEDLSSVEKFEIADEDYAKRTDSVRAFKERMKMGQFKEVDPEEQKRIEEEKKRKEQAEIDEAAKISVGSRCEVAVQGNPVRRGTVMYVGTTSFKPGQWVGIKYDEPMGKNDGSVQGKRYFECPPKYGGFVKPNQVTVGDFPELGLEDEDMDEM